MHYFIYIFLFTYCPSVVAKKQNLYLNPWSFHNLTLASFSGHVGVFIHLFFYTLLLYPLNEFLACCKTLSSIMVRGLASHVGDLEGCLSSHVKGVRFPSSSSPESVKVFVSPLHDPTLSPGREVTFRGWERWRDRSVTVLSEFLFWFSYSNLFLTLESQSVSHCVS